MQNTPYRQYLEASPFSEPFLFEVPQLKHFYEQNLPKVEETPNKRSNTIFTLITSPVDAVSIARRRLLLLKSNDVFCENLDLVSSERKPKYEDMTSNQHKPLKTSNMQNKEGEQEHFSLLDHERETIISHEHDENHELREDDEIKMNEEFERETKGRTSGKEEIRKRKRKSNHQLKILKWEFERDGFWDKEKILNVAKITGLSESQVYKWCWDQKKKMELNSKERNKHKAGLEDKENIPPKEHLGVLKNSKAISKCRVKGKPFNPIRSTQKLKLKTLSDNNIIVDDVNKRLTFL